MPLIGTNINFGDTVPAAGAPTDTGQWFAAGITERGPVGTAVKVTSLSSFVSRFGNRLSSSVLYDSIEAYFRSGGIVAYVSRVAGPSVATATKPLLGAASAPSITVKAKDPGAWGNNLRVAVIAGTGSNVKLQISTVADGTLETSPEFATVAQAVAWVSTYTVVTADGTVLPSVIAAQALTGGSDDINNVTNTEKANALVAFNRNLGPGQVSYPGDSTSAVVTALLAHAAANTRVAIVDGPNSSAVADLVSAAAAVRTDINASFGALFGPWVQVPGIAGGTVRTIPASPVIAGLISDSDRYFSPGRAVAGQDFPLKFVVGFSDFNDVDRDTATLGSVNLTKNVYGTLVNYGFRSLVDPNTKPDWVQFTNARLRMAVTAELNARARSFEFSKLDGAGHTLIQFKDALSGVLTDFYVRDDLYGATAAEAFRVDVGPSVNTPTSLGQGELHAQVAVRFTPFAERIYIDIAKTPITQNL